MTALRPARRGTSIRSVGFGVALALVCTMAFAPVSQADDPVGHKKKVDAEIAQLRGQLEDTSKVLTNAYVELRRTRAELPGAQQALVAAGAAQVVADRRNDQVAAALALAQANEGKARDALSRNDRDTQQVQDQLGNMARDEYQQGGISTLAIALEANSPEDFTNRVVMVDTVRRVRGATLRGLDTTRAEGTAVRSHLVAVRQQVAALKAQAEAALARATAARATAAAAKTRLDLLNATQTRYAAWVAARKAIELKSLGAMKAQSDFLARVLSARARAARARAALARAGGRVDPGPPGSTGGFLDRPVNGPVSSEFGMRFHPIFSQWILHAGMDFAVNCGTPVFAAADGEVIMTTPESASGGYGNRLVIDHGLRGVVDLTTTYNHLTSFVRTGGQVRRGELVAYSGTTGNSTGCHMHFETRQDGNPVNPRGWL